MSDWGDQNDAPQEDAPNPTQEAIDESGPSDQPADASWSETQDTPHEGEEGQAGDVA